jgi:hypothetical protein
LLDAVTALWEKLDVTIVDLSTNEPGNVSGESAFLGAGANGRVSKLTSGAVLKIVVEPKSETLRRSMS